ncbi:NfeD family protein [Mariprofundus ferrooxydans]|nr:NfeD family protein [Mariprofundus ferrooxydans]
MLDSLGLDIWHVWLLAACLIVVVELVLLGSYYLLALAAGAAVVGGVAAFMDLSATAQWLIFTLATIIAALLMRYLRTPVIKDDVSHMVGALVSVMETVSPRGRVVYKSVTWAAESADKLEKGASARVVGVRGSTLYVTKIEENS